MKYLIPILSILAIAIVIFNITKLDFNSLFVGESFTAVLTIIAGLCALMILQILRISKKINTLIKKK